jgi:hypothetical protein
MTRRLLVLGLVAVATAGCAGQKAARITARTLLAQTIRYEGLVDRNITADEAYYTNRVTSLTESLDRLRKIDQDAQIQRQAGVTAADWRTKKLPVAPAHVSEFITTLLRTQGDALEQAAQRRLELRTLLTESLEPLELDKTALKKMRKRLERLQLAPGEIDHLNDLKTFISATKKAYDDQASKEDTE